MLRRRRRTALIAVLLAMTLGWAWHATQGSPEASGGTSLNAGDLLPTVVQPSAPASSGAQSSPAANSGAQPSQPASSRQSPAATRTPVASSHAPVSRPTGRLMVVPGTGPIHGSGPLRRFIVEVEAGLAIDPETFAATVERTLGDRRSWGRHGVMSFQRVSSGPVAFRVVLASPHTVDRHCAPLRTNGYLSCYIGGRSVVNVDRWQKGVPWYAQDLDTYRQYVINHEVGHALGHGHQECPGEGALAPVMQQQSKGMQGCRPNAWPYP